MEQHLHRQCCERLLCLSNYIYSKVLDSTKRRGEERRGEREEKRRKEESCGDARLTIKNTVIERKNAHSHTHTHTHTHTEFWATLMRHEIPAAHTKKQHRHTHSLWKTKTQSVAYVSTRGEAGRIALSDICVLSCLSPQHAASAKYALPDNKSARTLRATQICLQTKWRLTKTSRGRQQTMASIILVVLGTRLSLLIPLVTIYN